MKIYLLYGLLLACTLICCKSINKENTVPNSTERIEPSLINDNINIKTITRNEPLIVVKDIPIRTYFRWMDSIVSLHDEEHDFRISEYSIVHNNPWILDTLAHTDYYYLKEKGIFNEDSQALTALYKGQTLILPDSIQNDSIMAKLANTYIDINIPEFRLRIIENGKVRYSFPIRVGQNGARYLAMAKRKVDMRTKPGIGKIIRVNKNPLFINPKDNRRYNVTKRDDGKVTRLPIIPWLEPELDGHRFGQLIHPTTNLETLNRPYSNGCIGLRESDAWIVYYFAPVGTKIVIRYDLEGKNEDGQKIIFTNIYPGFENKTFRTEAIESALMAIDGRPIPVCDCRDQQP